MKNYHFRVPAFLLMLACANTPDASAGSALVFERRSEPREGAYTVLVPNGWEIDGGIFRVDALSSGGPGNAIAAKNDFTVRKDRQGSVQIRWLPDVMFFDASQSPAGQMGMFPPGSNYQGMTVYPVMPAPQFIVSLAFPYAHPNASNVQVVEQKPLPKLAQSYQQRVYSMMPGLTFTYDAAMVTFTYDEGGVTYYERMTAMVENWGQLGAGLWGNKESICMRAPKGELDRWEPVLSVIQNSIQINTQWLAGELKGQAQRGEIVANTQREIQRIEQEIYEHRRKTNEEIHNDMFLTLTDQEEYVNPHTNEVEIGSNQWKYRWVNEGGEVIYTDEESYNPNIDVNLNRTGFERTPIREREPR